MSGGLVKNYLAGMTLVNCIIMAARLLVLIDESTYVCAKRKISQF